MELSQRFDLILVLAAAGVIFTAIAARGNAGDSAQGMASDATAAAATSTTAFITGEQGVIYFPSQYTLNAPEPAGAHIQAF